MAIGDLGIFFSPESNYRVPGQYEAALRGEATKRASYLSSMDQFYAGLDETIREFDERMGLERDRLALAQETLEAQKSYQQGLLGIQQGQLKLKERSLDAQKSYQQGLLRAQQRQLERSTPSETDSVRGTWKGTTFYPEGSESSAPGEVPIDFLREILRPQDSGGNTSTPYQRYGPSPVGPEGYLRSAF